MLKLSGTISGQPYVHILHAFHDDSTPNSTDLQTMANAVMNAWSTNIKPLQCSTVQFSQVTVTDISKRDGAIGTSNITAFPGTAAGAQAANNVAYAVSWTIGRRYRGGHPRSYFCGFPGTFVLTGNQIATTTRTSWLNAWLAIKTAIEATGLASIPNPKMCSISYYLGKNDDGSPKIREIPVKDPILGVKGDLRIDSQRHRLGRPL